MGRPPPPVAEHSALHELPSLIPMGSPEGMRMLGEAGTVDHGPLMRWFEGQERLCFCSVASSVITLNALYEQQKHAQNRFFSPTIEIVRSEAQVDMDGMTLAELGSVLSLRGARVEIRHAEEETLESFRTRAVENLHRSDDFIIVNYLRETLGQTRGGHFSPLAAWHEETDRFLVLDVADMRYPWVWVSSTRLFAAMSGRDAASGRSRGWLSVSLPPKEEPVMPTSTPAHDQDALAAGATIDVNSNLEERVVVCAADMPWDPSPWIPGIGRKFLDRYGNGQFVPSTSVVSFARGVRDPYHAHPHGEEYYVLSGVFTDHTGDYLPGFYVRHPMRWCHAPYVDPRNDDAVVFVKVSQISEEGEPIVVIDTCDMDQPGWRTIKCRKGSIRHLQLYHSKATGERVWVEIWEPGTAAAIQQPAGGEEIFVIEGALYEDGVQHKTQTWIRNPTSTEGKAWAYNAPQGCKLLRKSGHLPTVAGLYARAKDGGLFRSSPLQYRQEERIHGDLHGVDTKRRERMGDKKR